MIRLFILIAVLLASCVNEPEVTKIEYKGIGWLTFGKYTYNTVETILTIEGNHGLLLIGKRGDVLINIDHYPELGFVAGLAKGKYGDSTSFVFQFANDTLSGSYTLEYDNGIGFERHIILTRNF